MNQHEDMTRDELLRELTALSAAGETDTVDERLLRLAAFPQQNPNPVLEVDFSGRVIFSNPATRKVLENLGMDKATLQDIAVRIGLEEAKVQESKEELARPFHIFYSFSF